MFLLKSPLPPQVPAYSWPPACHWSNMIPKSQTAPCWVPGGFQTKMNWKVLWWSLTPMGCSCWHLSSRLVPSKSEVSGCGLFFGDYLGLPHSKDMLWINYIPASNDLKAHFRDHLNYQLHDAIRAIEKERGGMKKDKNWLVVPAPRIIVNWDHHHK